MSCFGWLVLGFVTGFGACVIFYAALAALFPGLFLRLLSGPAPAEPPERTET